MILYYHNVEIVKKKSKDGTVKAKKNFSRHCMVFVYVIIFVIIDIVMLFYGEIGCFSLQRLLVRFLWYIP